MAKFTYILLMLIIAVLFTGFSFSMGIVIDPTPQYNDYCGANERSVKPIPVDETKECAYLATPEEECQGYWVAEYDDQGCTSSYYCELCQVEHDNAQEAHNVVMLITLAILGLGAIILGLYYAPKTKTIEWILNGFLLGGLVNLFIGTVFFISDIPTLIRPIILLVELGIIVGVALKKFDKIK